jgi:pectin methylesterase-like acyl-CoA thioesterase
MARHSNQNRSLTACAYCNQPIKPSQEKYTATSSTNQNIGVLHAYCHPFIQDDFDGKDITVKTGAGVAIKSKRKKT